MSEPHSHAGILLAVVRELDDLVALCAKTGNTPVVDAVELGRLLRALVEGRDRHETLAGDGAIRNLKVLTLGWTWKPEDDSSSEWIPYCPLCRQPWEACFCGRLAHVQQDSPKCKDYLLASPYAPALNLTQSEIKKRRHGCNRPTRGERV